MVPVISLVNTHYNAQENGNHAGEKVKIWLIVSALIESFM